MSVIAQDGRQEKHKEDGVNTWKKRFRLFQTGFIYLSSFIVFAGVFFLSHLFRPSSYPPSPPPPVRLSSPSLQYMQSYWAVKCEKLQHAIHYLVKLP